MLRNPKKNEHKINFELMETNIKKFRTPVRPEWIHIYSVQLQESIRAAAGISILRRIRTGPDPEPAYRVYIQAH